MLTLAILKPDALSSGKAGRILAHVEGAGFVLRAARLVLLSEDEAKAFYQVHEERPFFKPLVAYMTSGPCLPMVLEHPRAVEYLREVVGATDPTEAAEGTVRRLYAESKERNAIHASDSAENARKEVGFFFPQGELERLWRGATR